MMHSLPSLAPQRSGQRGAVLFIALILLLVLTLIGVTSMQSTTLQERMAGNMRDYNLAFQAAEVALRAGEVFLQQPVLPNFSDDIGFYQAVDMTQSNPPDPIYETVDWDNAGESAAIGSYDDGPSTLEGVATPPSYIVEELPPVIPVGGSLAADTAAVSVMYRITAHATGGSDKAEVILQTTFRR